MVKQVTTDQEKKVIPFPNLNARLLERSVQSLRDKDYEKALHLFEQLNRIEPDNSQAAYGLAVCYVELECYTQAEDLTESMMKRGIGDFYDVLKLHVTILIQQHHYDKVLSSISAVLSEETPPPNIRETLSQLADFARVRMEEGSEIENETIDIPSFYPNIKQDLASSQVDRQWRGIQNGKAFITKEVLQDYLDYLKNETGDPFLKSMVIKLVLENGHKGPLTVCKFGKQFHVDLKETNLFYEGFSNLVEDLLEEALSSENPTLLSVTAQIWGHFTIFVYPKPLEPNLPNVWAAACFVFGHQMNALEINHNFVKTYFNVTNEDLIRPLSLLKSIEENMSPYEFN